jgi:hypothetical protein
MIMPVRPVGRRWKALTTELNSPGSAIRAFIDSRFGNIGDAQWRYREHCGPLLVPGMTTASAGTLGGAFDWLVRFMTHPRPDLYRAQLGTMWVPHLKVPMVEVTRLMGVTSTDAGSPQNFGVRSFQGPVPGTAIDEDLLVRGCWLLALMTEIYRVDGPRPGSPLVALGKNTIGADELLGLAPTSAVEELRRLREVADAALLPTLQQHTGPWALGPDFDHLKLMRADADLVAGGLLVEVKTTLGRKRTDGSRRAVLEKAVLQQLLGYVLLDFSDEYAIREICLYSARYGYLAVWDLQQLLDELSGKPVDLVAERTAFSALLGG